MPPEAEHKGKSSEERISPFCDPERDPIVACRLDGKIQTKITGLRGQKVILGFHGEVGSLFTSELRKLHCSPTAYLLHA